MKILNSFTKTWKVPPNKSHLCHELLGNILSSKLFLVYMFSSPFDLYSKIQLVTVTYLEHWNDYSTRLSLPYFYLFFFFPVSPISITKALPSKCFFFFSFFFHLMFSQWLNLWLGRKWNIILNKIPSALL